MSKALHPNPILVIQLKYLFTFEFTQALITPEEVLPLCCLDVSKERVDVLDPCILPLVSLVVAASCPAGLPLEKVDDVGVDFGEDVDRRACYPFFVKEGEEFDALLEFDSDRGYLIVCDLFLDFV